MFLGSRLSSVALNDNYSASSFERGLVTCKRTCDFTHYSKADFGTDEPLTVTCKVYKSKDRTLRFGLLPVQSTAKCTKALLGSKELPGSIGLSLEPGQVRLYQGGSRSFFDAKCATDDSNRSIKISIARGKVSFSIEGQPINPPELANMKFTGKVRIGLSMTTEGQSAEIYYTCPFKFSSNVSTTTVLRENIVVYGVGTSPHTVYSEDVVQLTGTYVLTVVCYLSFNQPFSVGLISPDSQAQCKERSVGEKDGDIACIAGADGKQAITLVASGDVLLEHKIGKCDPSSITVVVKDGAVSFQLNGLKVGNLEIQLRLPMRFGVGVRTFGQLLEVRGRYFKASGGGNNDDVGALGHQIQKKLAVDVATGALRFEDRVNSIRCDEYNRVAVGVRKAMATLFTERVVPAKSQESMELRILSLPPGQLMFVGALGEEPGPHADHHLGSAELKNSVGVTNRGDFQLHGSTMAVGIGFGAGDLVRLAFDDGRLSITVNGREAASELSKLEFKAKFRFAVSFTDAGQAVKIGSDTLREREMSFLAKLGVSNPAVSPQSQLAAVTPAAVAPAAVIPAAVAPAAVTPAPGPPGAESAWHTYAAPDGRVYYYNSVTGETRWANPGRVNAAPAASELPPGWIEYKAADGRSYYHNPATNQVTWARPRRHEASVVIPPMMTSTGGYLERGRAQTPTSVSSAPAKHRDSNGSNGSGSSVDRGNQMLDDLVESCRRDPLDITHDASPLAQGAFGKVYRGRYEDMEVAVKEMMWEDDENQRREIALGRLLSHPNIVSIMGWARSEDQRKLLVVMPLYRKGSLADKLDSVAKKAEPCPGRGGPFGWDFFFNVSLGLLRALKLMANSKPKPVIHRDIKPGNILLGEDRAVLADFGLARSLDSSLAMTMACTPMYMANEQLLGNGAGTATDVYAAALVIYEVLCAPRSSRRADNLRMLMEEILRGTPPRMDDVPAVIRQVLLPAMAADRETRPSAADMLAQLESAREKILKP